MRHIIFFIIFTGLLKAKGQDYISYHHAINKIEQDIQQTEYQQALNGYNALFSNYDHRFYKDLHNACLCAIKLNDLEKAFDYARGLVDQGYLLADFDKYGFKDLKTNKRMWRAFEKDYVTIRQQYLNSQDTSERDFYYTNYQLDQKAASMSDIVRQDSAFFQLANRLSAHIASRGFPSVFLCKDTLGYKIQVMLRHYCGLYNRIKNDDQLRLHPDYSYRAENIIKPIVDSALTQGYISPEVYKDIVSYHDGNPFGVLAIKIDIDNEEVYPTLKVKPEDLNRINKLRKSIGLMAIDSNANEFNMTGTWYANYPFEQVKMGVEHCDTCTTFMDYVSVHNAIENCVRNAYNSQKEDGFILSDYFNVKDIYYEFKFMRDVRKKEMGM
ncbi:MAG: hypothetical protein N4A74_15850 [Carboxylicivirga sp.]|jgi:hypothetical protein|nr:hypothetical protein [Carboxylicivirga sp.]